MNSFDKRLNAVSEKIKNTVGVGYHVTYKDGSRCFMNLLDLFNNMDTWGDIVDIVETPDSGNNLIRLLVQDYNEDISDIVEDT